MCALEFIFLSVAAIRGNSKWCEYIGRPRVKGMMPTPMMLPEQILKTAKTDCVTPWTLMWPWCYLLKESEVSWNWGMVDAGVRGWSSWSKYGRATSRNCESCWLTQVLTIHSKLTVLITNKISIVLMASKYFRLVPKWASKEQFLGNEIRWVWFPGSLLPHLDIDWWKHTMFTNSWFYLRYSVMSKSYR